jgi:transketolase
MPCWELFAEQSKDYRESVLPAALTRRLSVEAGVTLGWRQWVGDRGETIGIDRFGASAPGPTLMKEFGFTAEQVVARALGML